MSGLYSLNQEWPQPLPFRVKLPHGSTRTDPATFSSDELSAWGYDGPHSLPPHDDRTEILEWSGTAFSVRPMTTEERQVVLYQQWAAVRTQRNQRLAECDWTQLPDAPVDAAAWAVYRQELRDITQQPDPFNLVWPTLP